MKTRILLVLLVTNLIGACASVPTQYLALQARAPEGSAVNERFASQSHWIIVDHVQIPAEIDRLSLTQETARGLQIAPHARWLAPLGGMMQRVLAADLQRSLPHTPVVLAGAPLPAAVQPIRVRVQVNQFLPLANGKVILEADYFLLDGKGKTLCAARFRQWEKGGQSPQTEALGMSHAVAALAEAIGQEITALH